MKKVTIVGAGLVGSLLAAILAKKGYTVDVYERRPDMRSAGAIGGRSINLALSTRGWTAIDEIGISDRIKEIAIPMRGRMIHHADGSQDYQPYGIEDQAIYSVSRAQLNIELMNAADGHSKVNFHFNSRCETVDFEKSLIQFDQSEDQPLEVTSDLIFGTDGAYSAVRYEMQKTRRFNFSQDHLSHGYKELTIPGAADGSHQIETEALHIWPRGHFMLIALPNLDGSFTCTLFAPFDGPQGFDNLRNTSDVRKYFEEHFGDALPLMPTLEEDFFDNPTSSLVTIRCNPWFSNNTLLMGDASHAIVPFYGQGMNSGFEDCHVLSRMIDEYNDNWTDIIPAFSKVRIDDANAIADLALQNFIEMRDLVGDPRFLLRKKIEKHLLKALPEHFLPLYSMVTFSNIPYAKAQKIGQEQGQLLDEIMRLDNIDEIWNSEQVVEMAKAWYANR